MNDENERIERAIVKGLEHYSYVEDYQDRMDFKKHAKTIRKIMDDFGVLYKLRLEGNQQKPRSKEEVVREIAKILNKYANQGCQYPLTHIATDIFHAIEDVDAIHRDFLYPCEKRDLKRDCTLRFTRWESDKEFIEGGKFPNTYDARDSK